MSMRQPRAGIFALAVLVASAAGGEEPAKLAMPGPEAKNLMLGKWEIRVKYEPSPEMPKGGTATGREVWSAGPAGRSVLEDYEEWGTAGEYRGHGAAWWDEKAGGERVVWCDSQIPAGCEVSKSVAHWEGNSLVYTEETEENGRKGVRQEIFTEITPTSFTQYLKAGPSLSQLKTTVTIHATRVPPPK